MANNIQVVNSNDFSYDHYVVDNANLADAVGEENNIATEADSTAASNENWLPYIESYSFAATGWNIEKNVCITGTGDTALLLQVENFVHADIDLSNINANVMLNVAQGKRGNYETGNGNDYIAIHTATNNDGASNIHKICTNDGNDIVEITEGTKTSSLLNYFDGRFTVVEANLGDGDDIFKANGNIRSKDVVFGGLGADEIDAGLGADKFLYNSAAESTSTSTDTLLSFETGVDKIILDSSFASIADVSIQAGAGFNVVSLAGADFQIQVNDTVTMSDIIIAA